MVFNQVNKSFRLSNLFTTAITYKLSVSCTQIDASNNIRHFEQRIYSTAELLIALTNADLSRMLTLWCVCALAHYHLSEWFNSRLVFNVCTLASRWHAIPVECERHRIGTLFNHSHTHTLNLALHNLMSTNTLDAVSHFELWLVIIGQVIRSVNGAYPRGVLLSVLVRKWWERWLWWMMKAIRMDVLPSSL